MQDKLVGKQMRRWEIDQRIRQRFQTDEARLRAPTHVITVSRQWGSGGTNIAKLVAKELDLKLYDKEIIDYVAELSGAEPRQIRHHDEHEPDVVSEVVLQLLEGKHPTGAGYLRALVRVIRQIARKGDAVIVGRGGACILPASFRVRIVAPLAIRIARIAELHQMDEKTARRVVVQSDRQRYRFVRARFGCDPHDPLLYDIVINTEYCSIDHAAGLVIKGFTDRREVSLASCKAST